MFHTDFQLNLLEYFFDETDREEMNFSISMLVKSYMKPHLKNVDSAMKAFAQDQVKVKMSKNEQLDRLYYYLMHEVLRVDPSIDRDELSDFVSKFHVSFGTYDSTLLVKLPASLLGVESMSGFVWD